MYQPAVAHACFVLLLSACTGSAPPSWHKPGADEAVAAKDTAECHDAAEQEAELRYPRGFATPMLSAPGLAMAQQRANTDRVNAATASFNACMRERGYVRAAR